LENTVAAVDLESEVFLKTVALDVFLAGHRHIDLAVAPGEDGGDRPHGSFALEGQPELAGGILPEGASGWVQFGKLVIQEWGHPKAVASVDGSEKLDELPKIAVILHYLQADRRMVVGHGEINQPQRGREKSR
jgi:hypothetical protein